MADGENMTGSRIRAIDVPHDIDLLRRLKPDEIDFILAAGRPRRVRAGSLITYQSEPAEDLLITVERPSAFFLRNPR